MMGLTYCECLYDLAEAYALAHNLVTRYDMLRYSTGTLQLNSPLVR